ncbi:MAG: type I-B CRISPR-associated protein Cas5b [Candidatus Bathyarchaeota archaeon]|nr:type I-B CRISPR-associated protein Cas5b [Candidatus Bathyarchaeota archaeon]
MDRLLAFDLWGDYAHFRKHYTTTSPLTFSIPPRTTLCGLLAAIIGLDKTEYLSHFSDKDASIAVQPLNEMKKTMLAENLIDTKKSGKLMNRIEQRTQIRFELLKDPKYRIFVHHQDTSIYLKLKEMLEAHKTVYTPCLGLSELLANFKYVKEYDMKIGETESEMKILTALPKKNLIELSFQDDSEYLSETMPRNMLPDRTITEYSPVIVERKANPLKARVKKFIRLENDEAITFL